MRTDTPRTPYFLPSEIARLVLGYIENSGYKMTYKYFLKECGHLAEYVDLLKRGRTYPTTIMGKNLVEIMEDYAEIKLQYINRDNEAHSQLNLTLWNQLENTIRELKYNTGSRLHFTQGPHQRGRSRRANLNRTSRKHMRVVSSNCGMQCYNISNAPTDKNEQQVSSPVRRVPSSDIHVHNDNDMESGNQVSEEDIMISSPVNRAESPTCSEHLIQNKKDSANAANNTDKNLRTRLRVVSAGNHSPSPLCRTAAENPFEHSEVNRPLEGLSTPHNRRKGDGDNKPSVTRPVAGISFSESEQPKECAAQKKSARNLFEKFTSGFQGSPHPDNFLGSNPGSVGIQRNINSPHSAQPLVSDSMCPASSAVVDVINSPVPIMSGMLSTAGSFIRLEGKSSVSSQLSVRLVSDVQVNSPNSVKSVHCDFQNSPCNVKQSAEYFNNFSSVKSLDNVSNPNHVPNSVNTNINSPHSMQQESNCINYPHSVECLPVSAHPSPCPSIKQPFSVGQSKDDVQSSPYPNTPNLLDKTPQSPMINTVKCSQSLNHSVNSPVPMCSSNPGTPFHHSQTPKPNCVDHNVSHFSPSTQTVMDQKQTQNVHSDSCILSGNSQTLQMIQKSAPMSKLTVRDSSAHSSHVPTKNISEVNEYDSMKKDAVVESETVVPGTSDLGTSNSEKDCQQNKFLDTAQLNSGRVVDSKNTENYVPLTKQVLNSTEIDTSEGQNIVRPSPRPIVLDEAARHAEDVHLSTTSPKPTTAISVDGMFTDFSLTSFAGIGFTTPTKRSGDTQFSCVSTPFKSDTCSIIGKSPKRKRHHPKKRSMGGNTKSSSENNSNESGGEKDVLVPLFLEKVIKNPTFTTKLAETINSTRLSHEHGHNSDDKKTAVEIVEPNVEKVANNSTNSVEDILGIQAMSEDTVQRIIKMTEDDPALDGLFSLFNSDIPLLEKSNDSMHPPTSSADTELQMQTSVSQANSIENTEADISKMLHTDVTAGKHRNDYIFTCNTTKIAGEPITTLLHITESKKSHVETNRDDVSYKQSSDNSSFSFMNLNNSDVQSTTHNIKDIQIGVDKTQQGAAPSNVVEYNASSNFSGHIVNNIHAYKDSNAVQSIKPNSNCVPSTNQCTTSPRQSLRNQLIDASSVNVKDTSLFTDHAPCSSPGTPQSRALQDRNGSKVVLVDSQNLEPSSHSVQNEHKNSRNDNSCVAQISPNTEVLSKNVMPGHNSLPVPVCLQRSVTNHDLNSVNSNVSTTESFHTSYQSDSGANVSDLEYPSQRYCHMTSHFSNKEQNKTCIINNSPNMKSSTQSITGNCYQQNSVVQTNGTSEDCNVLPVDKIILSPAICSNQQTCSQQSHPSNAGFSYTDSCVIDSANPHSNDSLKCNNDCRTPLNTSKFTVNKVNSPLHSENSMCVTADSSVNSDSKVCYPIRQLLSSTLQIQPDSLTTERDTTKKMSGICPNNMDEKQESNIGPSHFKQLRNLLAGSPQCKSPLLRSSVDSCQSTFIHKTSEKVSSNSFSGIVSNDCVSNALKTNASISFSPAVDSPGSVDVLVIDEQKRDKRKCHTSKVKKQRTPIKIAPKPTPEKRTPRKAAQKLLPEKKTPRKTVQKLVPKKTPQKIAPKRSDIRSGGLTALLSMVSPSKENKLQLNPDQGSPSCASNSSDHVALHENLVTLQDNQDVASKKKTSEKDTGPVSVTRSNCITQKINKSTAESNPVCNIDKLNKSTEERLSIANSYVESFNHTDDSRQVAMQSSTSALPVTTIASSVSSGSNCVTNESETCGTTSEKQTNEKPTSYYLLSPCGKVVYEVPVIETEFMDSISTSSNNVILYSQEGVPIYNHCSQSIGEPSDTNITTKTGEIIKSTKSLSTEIDSLQSVSDTVNETVNSDTTQQVLYNENGNKLSVQISKDSNSKQSSSNYQSSVKNSSTKTVICPQSTFSNLTSSTVSCADNSTDSSRQVWGKSHKKLTSPTQSGRKKTRHSSSSSKKSDSASTVQGYFYSPHSDRSVELQTPSPDKNFVYNPNTSRSNRSIHVKKLEFGGEEILDVKKIAEKTKRIRQGQIKKVVSTSIPQHEKNINCTSTLTEIDSLTETSKRVKAKEKRSSKTDFVKNVKKTSKKTKSSKAKSISALSKSVTVVVCSDHMDSNQDNSSENIQKRQELEKNQKKPVDHIVSADSQFKAPNKTPVKNLKSEVVIDASMVQQTIARLNSPEKIHPAVDIIPPSQETVPVKTSRRVSIRKAKNSRPAEGNTEQPKAKRRKVTPQAKKQTVSPQHKLAEGLQTIDVGQILSQIYN